MERKVRQHIEDLEAAAQRLQSEPMTASDLATRNALDAEIRAAQLALTHYRIAMDLEKNLSIAEKSS